MNYGSDKQRAVKPFLRNYSSLFMWILLFTKYLGIKQRNFSTYLNLFIPYGHEGDSIENELPADVE